MSEPTRTWDGRLQTITAAAAAILDARTPEALRTILEISCERVVPFDDFEFVVYDASTDRLRVIGDPDALPVPVEGSPWLRALRDGRSSPLDDGACIVPVLDGTRSLGAFRLRPRPDRTFTPEDRALLDALGALAASALLVLDRIAAARAAEAAARRPDAVREAVHIVASAAGAALMFEEAAGVALAALCELSGLPAGHAWVLSGDEFVSTGVWQMRDVAAWGTLCARLSGRRFPRAAGLPGAVAARGAPFRVTDALQDPAFADIARLGARGLWGVPVLAGRDVAAVLGFFSSRPLARDRALDVIAMDVVAPLGQVIERDRRLASARLAGRMLESAGAALIGSDAGHRIVLWNRAAESLFGWSREEVLGRVDSDVLRTRAQPGQTAEITQRLAAGQPWEGEFQITRRDGAVVPVLLCGAAVPDADGSPGGYVGVAVDLRRSHAAELHRRQSFAMDAVGRLAGAVAHDFNNLLTGIRGIAQLVLDDLPADSPLRSDLGQIATAAERAATLTARLLAFGRQQVLRPRMIDAVQLVHDLEIDMRRTAGAGAELAIDSTLDEAWVHADPAQLGRALLDLVAHAAEHGADTVHIRLAAVRLTGAEARALDLRTGDWITLDTVRPGPSPSAEEIERLFEPAPASASGLDQELGLGTAYGVIRQSDGTITVETAAGSGTTLRVWLPRQDRPAVVRPPAPGPASAGTSGTETLLLVEDEATVRNLARKVLARQGYTVIEAADGTEALALFERDPDAIDLVVTDIIMPSMGGPELVRRLRALRNGLPVLLMSGYTDDATLRRGLARADEAFLEKPFVPDTLVRKVRELLDAAHAHAD